MSIKDTYLERLDSLSDWLPYLSKNSGLPGPRGNIELAQAVAEKGTKRLFDHYLALGTSGALTDSQREYLAFCGVLGYGRLASEGHSEHFPLIRRYASDSRWRVREAAAMALQRVGMVNMELLLKTVRPWLRGGWLEQRAAAAGLCEPALLARREHAEKVLGVLDAITRNMTRAADRKAADFRVLRKGMAYCWSVAVSAAPVRGKTYMERWMVADDNDVSWIMLENLRKKRMERMDAEWVRTWRNRIALRTRSDGAARKDR
jgi:hypothetical protein